MCAKNSPLRVVDSLSNILIKIIIKKKRKYVNFDCTKAIPFTNKKVSIQQVDLKFSLQELYSDRSFFMATICYSGPI